MGLNKANVIKYNKQRQEAINQAVMAYAAIKPKRTVYQLVKKDTQKVIREEITIEEFSREFGHDAFGYTLKVIQQDA